MNLLMCQQFKKTDVCIFIFAFTTIFVSLISGKIVTGNVSPGYRIILNDDGVQVYKKNNQSPKLEYVTVINIKNATIENLTGVVSNSLEEEVRKKILSEFWLDAVQKNTANSKVKVVINGAFFATKKDPTGIAFGLKAGGNTITYGYGIGKEYPGQIRTFAWNSIQGDASIQNYMVQTFHKFPNVLGGLDMNANKSAKKYLPRTFVGVRDEDGDGDKETVIFYSSNYARQIDASRVLRSFGASSIVMLDGGGSTGLIVNGKALIATNRPIPHALAVYAGK